MFINNDELKDTISSGNRRIAINLTDKKESLLSKKNLKGNKDPLDDNNPITVQVLGICSF